MKKAFTLAEVLITLGIIGVISAITIPSLLTKVRYVRDSAILKEDFSILKQMMLSANDDGAMGEIVVGNNMDEMKKWFNTYFLPYIKVVNVCYGTSGCFASKIKTSNGSIMTSNIPCGWQSLAFTLNNGSYVCMDDFGDSRFGVIPNSQTIGILVDINGDKNPNQLGKDIFAFVFKDESLVPGGYDMTQSQIDANCSEKCSSGPYCGTYCTQKAVQNGYKLPLYGK